MWLKEKILGGKKKQETVTLLIPDEALAIIETSDLEGAKALMVVNRALKEHQDDTDLHNVRQHGFKEIDESAH